MAFKSLKYMGFVSLAMLVSACSQTPAKVVMKGNQYYGIGEMPREVQMASARSSAPVVTAKPAYKPVPQAAPVRVAAVQNKSIPQENYDYRPIASSMETRSAKPVELAQVEVKELAPITVNSLPPLEAPVAVASVAPAQTPAQAHSTISIAPADQPSLLPKPQAPAVAESSAPAEMVASKGYIWPVKGEIISPFGAMADGEYNDGINISAREGEPIVAAADGEVVYSGNALPGYGNMVILRHAGNIMTAYAHASKILVEKGDKVQQGIAIATVGKSGRVNTPQVHFGVRKDKEPMDPMAYLGQQNFANR